MFTVKATYRGETRKLSFDYTTSFPTYDELCSQLYRVFPINNNYYLSRLLFSPNATSPARILIATEIHTQDDYLNAVQSFSGRVYPNALLRFSVYDDTPHKQPSSRSSLSSETNIPTLFTPPPSNNRPSTSSDSDKRPTVPPKPAELFLPFEYISALSGRTPIHSHKSTPHSVPAPMEVDSTPQPQSQAQLPAQSSTPKEAAESSSPTSTLPCCSPAEVKEEIRGLITSFEKEVNAALEKGFGSPAAPQVSVVLSESTNSTAPVSTRPTIRKASAVDLGGLFADGAFPSNGPTRKASTRSIGRNGSLRTTRSNSSLAAAQPTGCLNASQSGRPLPQVPEQVVHTHVVCDTCLKTVVGIRHKCLDCPDFDLCSSCIKDGAAEKHNPFHEFFEIKEPGRVIVHTVFSEGDRFTQGNNSAATSPTAPPTPRPAPHAATCDLCESSIVGIRYKCCDCPDFDTCTTCFKIIPEQHPNHSFFKIEKPDDYVRNGHPERKAHFARCDSCSKTIYGVRYKCMHPECPDFDLCARCEAMPIPVHPTAHPLLKMKAPEVVIPTVYRVGGTEVIPAESTAPTPVSTRQHRGYQPAYHTPEGYSPAYITSGSSALFRTPLAVPVPIPSRSEDEHMHEDERATTPRPNQEKSTNVEEMLMTQEDEDVDARNPFADPPMIAPFDNVSGSMVSSFTATVEDLMKGARTLSPLAEAAEKERSLFEGFLDRPATREEENVEEKEEKQPSFVNDVLEDFFKAFAKKEEIREPQVEMKEKEEDETLSTLVSGVSRLVALVAGEVPASPAKVEVKVVEEQTIATEEVRVEAEEKQVDTEKAVEEEPEVAKEVKIAVVEEVTAKEPEEVPRPALSAGFISDVTVPDGQVFPPGAEFMKCWRMVNDGPVAWPESTEVVFVAGQSGLVAAGNESVKIGSVKAGEEVDVWTGELKAPDAAGRYVGYWRLRDGETREVFGNSIWVEIQVAETDHHSDDTASMSGSSIVMMPTGLASATGSTRTSVRPPQSLTLTIPSSTSTSMDGESDIGSDGSLIDYMSEGEEVAGWEEARNRVGGAASAAPPATAVPGSPLGDEFELVYDSSSDM